jgi:acetyl esterase/lipase
MMPPCDVAVMQPPPAYEAQASARQVFEFPVRDIVYRRDGNTVRLARLYQPAGTGPFPAVVQVHGGAWNTKDRTDGQHTALDLAGEASLSCPLSSGMRRRRRIRRRCRTSPTESAG